MLKKTILALVASSVIAAVAAPAFASTDPLFNATTPDQLTVEKASIVTLLNQRGIKATDVDSWGQYLKADVTLANGTQQVQFFVPGTLQPVDINHLN